MKIRFLTVVWGQKYIKNFCDLALASWLAPRNLPALRKVGQLEVCIMTQQKDFRVFARNRAFQRLKEQTKVNFVAIDDLVNGGVYGVTLTLAYARPILALGPKMKDYHFVFMNADFVLADGSLESLAKKLQEGETVVLAPSLRVVEETTIQKIKKRIEKKTGILAMPPREILRIVLPELHPTTWAKVLNFGRFHTIHPNQLFWRVDEDTLIARYFLIFMLSIKPNREIREINSWCDYGFVPEFCPGAKPKIMGDSDNFLMVEFQEKLKEREFLKIGPFPPHMVAKSLNEWVTHDHFRNAESEIIFHRKELSADIAKEKVNFRRELGKLGLEKVRPRSHRFHHYWISGLRAWEQERFQYKKIPELAALPFSEKWGNRPLLNFERIKRKHPDYAYTPEEPLMDPRLSALVKFYQKSLRSSRKATILAGTSHIADGLLLAFCAGKKEKIKTSLIWLPDELGSWESPESDAKNRKACLLAANFPPAETVLRILKKYGETFICLLPETKNDIRTINERIADFHLACPGTSIKALFFYDPGFWFMKKIYQWTKAFCVHGSKNLRQIMAKILGGKFSVAQLKTVIKQCEKWRVTVPFQIMEPLIKDQDHSLNSGENPRGLKKRATPLKIFNVEVPFYGTKPKEVTQIRFPSVRIPFLYKTAYLFGRCFRDNGFAQKIFGAKWSRSFEINEKASLFVFKIIPKNCGWNSLKEYKI